MWKSWPEPTPKGRSWDRQCTCTMHGWILRKPATGLWDQSSPFKWVCNLTGKDMGHIVQGKHWDRAQIGGEGNVCETQLSIHTCQFQADGTVIISMLVAHLEGQVPHIPPTHPGELQWVLVIIRHPHLPSRITILQHHTRSGSDRRWWVGSCR